jgi:hypothetical protein
VNNCEVFAFLADVHLPLVLAGVPPSRDGLSGSYARNKPFNDAGQKSASGSHLRSLPGLPLTDSQPSKCASRRADLAHQRHTMAHMASGLPVTRSGSWKLLDAMPNGVASSRGRRRNSGASSPRLQPHLFATLTLLRVFGVPLRPSDYYETRFDETRFQGPALNKMSGRHFRRTTTESG